MSETIQIPYGKKAQTLEVDTSYEVLRPKALKGHFGTQEETIEHAMASPIDSWPLWALASDKPDAVIICSDHTRPVPSRLIIPPMLAALRRGNPNIKITLLIATGFHRPTSEAELIAKFGEEIVHRENIVIHDSSDEEAMVDIGRLPSGARLKINRLAAEASLVCAEGFIEPHFFAGFSGGRKSVLPGICAKSTVMENHCAAFIADENARAGVLDGNPIHQDMVAAARMAGLAFIVNVILDENKMVVDAVAGDAISAHRLGCAVLSDACTLRPTRQGDIVITSNGGYPLDQNLYQAVKGMTAAEAAAKPGGIIIIASQCIDGAGGEDFYRDVRDAVNASALERAIQARPAEETVADQWETQILARILRKHPVVVVANQKMKKTIEEMKMAYASSVQEAYDEAKASIGPGSHCVIIPDGVSVAVRL